MSKSSLILGILLSVVAHGALLGWFITNPTTDADPAVPDKGTITLLPPPPAVTEPKVKPAPKPEPKRSKPQPPPQLAKVVEMPDPEPSISETGESSDVKSEAALPRMRILWGGPDQVRTIARELGLQIVAVDRDNRVLGSVDLTGAAGLIPFKSNFGDYSNRIRVLPKDYFGKGLSANGKLAPDALWVLVPARIDREFVAIQGKAIRTRGIPASQIRYVDAKFIPDDSGRHVLEIIKVHERKGVQ